MKCKFAEGEEGAGEKEEERQKIVIFPLFLKTDMRFSFLFAFVTFKVRKFIIAAVESRTHLEKN